MRDAVTEAETNRSPDDTRTQRLHLKQWVKKEQGNAQQAPDNATDNEREHHELSAIAQSALTLLRDEIRHIPPHELPGDIVAALSNLTAAIGDLQRCPANMRVPATVRANIRNSVVFVTSSQFKSEVEREEAEIESQRHIVIAETLHSKAQSAHAVPNLFGRNRKASAATPTHTIEWHGQRLHLTPHQEMEMFIGQGTDRTVRRVKDHGMDRRIVTALGAVIGENNADWAVNSTEIVGSSVATGTVAVLSGDTKKIEAGSRRWGLRTKHILQEHLGLSEDTAQYLGHGVTVATKALTYSASTVVGVVTNPLGSIEKGASMAYGAVTGMFWGTPPKGAQPQAGFVAPAAGQKFQMNNAEGTTRIQGSFAAAQKYLKQHNVTLRDVDGDGDVDVKDLQAFIKAWDKRHPLQGVQASHPAHAPATPGGKVPHPVPAKHH